MNLKKDGEVQQNKEKLKKKNKYQTLN